ncbi:MAG: acyltransferase [Bacteroidaceae bacterium]|nr:acyltransferase [Bacteroidaceae bacterium]
MSKLLKGMSLKRISQIFFMWLANTLPLRGHQRWRFVKLGGVDVKGPCWIYRNVYFDSVAPHLVTIGKNVTITQDTTILTHFLDPTQKGRMYRLGKVVIEDDVFIGCNTVICNSVTIGKGAIIGAGSIVTKDIPPYQCWAGNPARYIKDRAH